MTLVFHHGALGDSVLVHPLLASLAGEVTFVTHHAKAKLAARTKPHVHPANLDAPPWACLFASDSGDAALFRGVTTILSFVSDGQDVWAANVRRLAPHAKVCFIDPRPPATWTQHLTQWHRGQLQRQGLTLPPAPAIARRHNPDGPIVLHPGSGGLAKCWPPDRFHALAARLRHRADVRLIIGEAEHTRGQFPDATVLDTLDDLHDTIAAAWWYVGNDSGPTHLAARLGVPTLALFGPTDPRVWAPMGPAVTVLAPPRPGAMDWLDVDTVLEAAPPSASRRG